MKRAIEHENSRTGRRNGVVHSIQFPPRLHAAIKKKSALGEKFEQTVRRLLGDLLKVEPDKIVKRGPKPGSHRKPKTTTPVDSSSTPQEDGRPEAGLSQETQTTV